jgi:DNA polymerase-3 subunit epsilon
MLWIFTFPKWQNKNKINNRVAAHCGYDLKKHHHALADAEACAVIAMRIL